MRVETLVITPEMAEEMLTHNYEDNRRIRNNYVQQLVHVMKAGRYMSENGQTIVLGEDDGVLYDGQHRLKAIAESGCPQKLIVAHITNGKDAYKTIDDGTKRKAADFISLPDKTNSAAVGKVMACIEWGEASMMTCLQGKFATKQPADRGIIIAYCEQHVDEITKAIRVGRRMQGAVRCGSKALYAELYMIIRYCGMDVFLDEFVDEFTTEAPDSKTVIALKNTIFRAAASTRGIEKRWFVGTILNAYGRYCEMDNSTTFNKQQYYINMYTKLVQQRRRELSDSRKPIMLER